ARFPVPDFVWDEYHLDQEINDRGIMIDPEFVSNAIAFDERSRASLMSKMRDITGIDNPNSVQQMKEWLSDRGVKMESLGKKGVAKFVKDSIGNMDGNITEALKLRLQLAKSSVRKYQAMQNVMCSDGRAHGMFQFYGANRSGRWAGRLIQLQNLPQNHIPDLAEARTLVCSGDYDTMNLLYNDIPDTLSQLIRTDRKSTRLNSSHVSISYAVFCLKKQRAGRLQRNPLDRRPPRDRRHGLGRPH